MLRFSLILLFSVFCSLSYGQIVLEQDSRILGGTAPCTEITAGTTLSFQQGSSCGGAFVISSDTLRTVEFSTTDAAFTYDFPNPGQYIIFCNATASPTSEANEPTLCLTVLDNEVIPTMGEWGIIATFLLLLIFMTVAYRRSLEGTRAIA